MRFLLCTVLALAACNRSKSEFGGRTDTTTTAAPADTMAPAPTAAAPAAELAPKLEGTWKAVGYDSGSTRPSRFTIVWQKAPDGSLVGTITPASGPKYEVRIVSSSDSGFVQESAPHRSPTLGVEVVTHTEARLTGDSLTGTYQAKATTGSKSLSGKFSAKRTGAAP
jgi:hypothetical protein